MLNNFTNYRTIKELKSERFDWSIIPCVKGVYVVVFDCPNNPSFLSKGLGGFFKNINPNVSVEILKQKWVNFKPGDNNVVYIGKAGGENVKATLKERIKSYIKFGRGKSSPHRGGRYIWQITNSDSLKVYWRESNDPIKEEKKMLLEFKAKHDNKLPFANLRM
ncbi:MAG TPA: hypothetical protein PK086_00280 [bacterium]|jgi:hypothetical protein|nr:hypothetical protein [bacterium]HQQ37998.1 hypothetical protein [bacterium]